MSTTIGQIRDFLHKTNISNVKPTKELPGPWAKGATAIQNAGNTAMYWWAAATGPIGGGFAMSMGVGKMIWGGLLWGLGTLSNKLGKGDAPAVAIGESFMGSGFENLCVGAAASFAPGVGQGIAGLFAMRNGLDVANNVYPDQLGRGAAYVAPSATPAP